MSESSKQPVLPESKTEQRVNRTLDGFISPTIRNQGEPELTRARVLVVQALGVAMIAVFSTLYQIRFGATRLGIVGSAMLVGALLIPFLLSRARSHVWVAGLLTGILFLTLSLANFATAGRAVASAIFISAIPLVATLTQGAKWGTFWAVLTTGHLVALFLIADGGLYEPLILPNPAAAANGSIRAAILVTLLISSTGILHAVFNSQASRRALRSEKHLERNQANYRQMLDSSPDGLFSVSTSGKIDFANQTLCHLLGYDSRQDIQGRGLKDLMIDADIGALRSKADEIGRSTAIDCEIRAADGTVIPVEVATSHMYVYGDQGQVFRVRDIRRFRDANLEAQILRSTFDQAPIGVAVLEMDSTVVYANDAYLELTAFRREELIGTVLLDHNRTDDSHDFLLSIQAALARGESVSVPKMDWTHFDVGPSFVDVRAFTIEPPSEIRPRWVTFVRDVSSVVDLEREVARSERIDSLGKLAGGIAHDFNNLLTVIMGQVDILDEDLGPDHWGHEYLATIMDACERSAALTSKVLDFSRKQALRPEIFLADEAIRGMLPILRQLVPERIAIDVAVEDTDSIRVRCDPSRFEQILLNLVANARDAIEDDGKISIRVRANDAPFHEEGTLGEVTLEITDDGAGMSQEVQSRIFDPFFTTKPVGEGTGLGLSTVHGIVHQSGGRLEVTSRVGVGSTFRVYLPATNAPLTVGKDRKIASELEIDAERGTVLIVEDNPAVRALVTRTVERLGFSAVAAQNGDEARTWIEDRNRSFEALISDIVMPGISGVEVARLFRSRFAHERIVLMSGYAQDEIGPIEELPPDIRFVQKPLTAQMLSRALTS